MASSILFLDTSFFSISESIVAVSLFFPMLYLLIFSQRLNVVRSVVLIGLAVLATRSYECYLVLGWPLVFVAAHRGRTGWTAKKYIELLTCSCCGLLFLMAIFISARSAMFPLNAGSRDGFALSMLLHLFYPPVWFSLLTLASIVWCLLWTDRKRGWVLMCIATFGCGLFVALLPPVMGIVMPPLQYVARVQTIYVPLVLGLIVLWKAMVPTVNVACAPDRQIELWRLAAGACFVATAFQWGATTCWDDYRSAFLRDLIEHRGVIPFEQSAVYDPVNNASFGPEVRSAILEEIVHNPQRVLKRTQSAQFNWNWGIPSLSVSLSAVNLGSISSIVCAPSSVGWQPFDPRKTESIPDLAEFGIPTKLGRD